MELTFIGPHRASIPCREWRRIRSGKVETPHNIGGDRFRALHSAVFPRPKAGAFRAKDARHLDHLIQKASFLQSFRWLQSSALKSCGLGGRRSTSHKSTMHRGYLGFLVRMREPSIVE